MTPDILGAGARSVDARDAFSNAHTDGMLVTFAAWPGHPGGYGRRRQARRKIAAK